MVMVRLAAAVVVDGVVGDSEGQIGKIHHRRGPIRLMTSCTSYSKDHKKEEQRKDDSEKYNEDRQHEEDQADKWNLEGGDEREREREKRVETKPERDDQPQDAARKDQPAQ
ncbi:hypothetical protein RJ640_006758 [Escallonia rubra]|uniref:Uncharacterized protein n=1 Tax=Escallonia rubra TaxID=112253 RepID=A0AA88UB14_9ASTE|nr:hypothetical protein RJ640_006758 [Escallonia rubra]